MIVMLFYLLNHMCAAQGILRKYYDVVYPYGNGMFQDK